MSLSTHWQSRHAWWALVAMAGVLSACGGGRSPLLDQATESRDAAPDAAPCPARQSLCNTYCTDTQVDPHNCGGCGIACNPGQLCSAGLCQATCGTGLSKCTTDGGPPYCANLQTDGTNCGQCGRACQAGTVCSAGTCATTCAAPLTQCGKGDVAYCADLDSDNLHCGTCGNNCLTGQTCWNGTCIAPCAGSLTSCNGTCVDTETDPQNCGSCGVSCGPYTHGSAVCSNGACHALCDAGYLGCPSGGKDDCVDPTSDRNNCGGCGQSCPVGCKAGECIRVVQIVGGYSDACALLSDGSVDCWGYNHYGQLGDGTTTDRASPTPVPGLTGATGVFTGPESQFTCAVLAKGSVKCWGYNHYGQLGDGTTTDRPSPTTVPGLTGVISMATGDLHACALLAGGTVDCWGYNGEGQLGDGTTIDHLAPAPVPGLGSVTALAAGSDHTCALLQNGTVECWGENQFDQLGVGTVPYTGSPTAAQGISNAVAIAAASEQTCAVLDDGSAKCWGAEWLGALGNGKSSAGGQPPGFVQGLANVVGLSVGEQFACAVLANGSVECWGRNDQGELGGGSTNTAEYLPVQVPGLSNAEALGAGRWHVCAMLDDGSAECWGGRLPGQSGPPVQPPTPVIWP